MLSITTRPTKFSEVIGQEEAVQMLKKIASAKGTVARAFVFNGSHGVGKTSMARIFGKSLNCSNFPKTGDVCNECESCRDAMSETSLLYLEFDASRIANVGAIQSIIDRSISSTGNTKYKRVIALDETHALSKESWTALLKVLEEGSEQVIWVFPTTETLPKTIMSRSWEVPFHTIPQTILDEYLGQVAAKSKIEISMHHTALIAAKSKGHLRDALQLLDQFALVGETCIGTSYDDLSALMLAILRKENIDSLLTKMTSHPLPRIKDSISLFLTNIFIQNGNLEKKIFEKGLASPLFKFFYSTEVRNALTDEYGVFLAFKSLQTLMSK